MINFFKPDTLADALALKQEHGQNACWFAGGSRLNAGHYDGPRYQSFISLENLGLNTISADAGNCAIGATVTLQEIIDSPALPAQLQEAFKLVYSRNLRNQSTIGGEIGYHHSASPILPALLAVDATVVLAQGEQMLLDDYLVNGAGRLIEKVVIATDLKAIRLHKIANSAQASPILTAVVSLDKNDNVRMALSGVTDTPARLKDAEGMVAQGLPADQVAQAIRDALPMAIDDFHASADYRRHVAGTVFARLINEVKGC